MGYSFKWILSHLSQSFTASFAASASYSFNAQTASFVTASNVYGPYGANSIISASQAVTAAFALNAGGGGGGTPGGADRTIQFNSGGFFSGSSNYTISTGDLVSLTGSLIISSSSGNPFQVAVPQASYAYFYDRLIGASTVIRVQPNFSGQSRIEGVNYGVATLGNTGFLIGGSSSDLILATNNVGYNVHVRPQSYPSGGGLFLVSGSMYVTKSVYFTGLTSTNQTNILTIDASTGQVYYTASSALAGAVNLNGIDQYVGRFSGSNAMETSSIYNDRSLRSIRAGDIQSLTITDTSHSALFGSASLLSPNVYNPTYPSTAHSFGKGITNVGSDIGFAANNVTSIVGANDFAQNLLTSTAPRIHFSGFDSGTGVLYAPFAGDFTYLGDGGRTNYAIVADLSTGNVVRVTGIYTPQIDAQTLSNGVTDSNFVDSTGANTYVGLLAQFSTYEVLVGSPINSTTSGNIVCFFLEGTSDGYYTINSNHAQNIGASAHGFGTHAEGYYSQTRGYYTHAENDSTIAAGTGSRASGYKSVGAGRYSNANNVFTAAGPTYYLKNAAIRRSNYNQNDYDYYYSFGSSAVGAPNPTDYVNNITWIVDSELGTRFNNNSYVAHDSALKCVVQIPSLDYAGIVELFAGTYGAVQYTTTLLDILPDGISSSIANVYITPIETNTFFESYDGNFGGGPGYGAFSTGVKTISTNSGSFAGGISTRTLSSGSFTYGQDLLNIHHNSFLFGRDADSVTSESFLFSINGNNNLYANNNFVGINTATLPNSGYRGLSVIGTASVSSDLYVNGNSYLGNDISDVTNITGSLIISNSYNLIGTGRVTGSFIISNSLNIIGTSRVTGSNIVSSSWQLIGSGTVTGSLIVSNSFTTIGTNTTTGSLLATGSFGLIGNQIITGSIQFASSSTQYFISGADYITFNTIDHNITSTGQIGWNTGDATLELGLSGSVGAIPTLKIGEQQIARVYNAQGSSITKGQVVYISGSQGNRIAVKLASATAELGSANTLGLVMDDIPNGNEGYILTEGPLYKLNTNGLTAGLPIYLSTTAGAYTQTAPIAPNHRVILGFAERIDATVGSLYIKVDNGYELDELHNVKITAPSSSGDLLILSQSVWINSKQLTGSYGLTGSLEIRSSYATQTQPAIQANTDGLLILGEYSTTPTAVAGALMYSGSDYYLGF